MKNQKKLKDLLAEKGITGPTEMARRLGMTTRQQAFQLYEGHRLPSMEMIARIHEAFDIPLEDLIHLKRSTPTRRGKPRRPTEEPPKA
jgi:transcriptional regulator with XRE-family HTH domain